MAFRTLPTHAPFVDETEASHQPAPAHERSDKETKGSHSWHRAAKLVGANADQDPCRANERRQHGGADKENGRVQHVEKNTVSAPA